jgi:hypothetical protein
MKLEIVQERPPTQTDPAFFIQDRGGTETVAIAGKYSINRCGVMQIEYQWHQNGQNAYRTLYTTEDLLDVGLNTDADLMREEEAGNLYWENNAWFEIWDTETEEFDDSVFFSIEEAYEHITNQIIKKGNGSMETSTEVETQFNKDWYEQGRKDEYEAIIAYLIKKDIIRKSMFGDGWVAVDTNATGGVDLWHDLKEKA